ncbi:MAG: ribonuclease E inhibitor RraB [Chloroflexota bacterium]
MDNDVETIATLICDAAIHELEASGVDFSRSMGTHHVMYFATEADAEAAGERLRASAFDVSIDDCPWEEERPWCLMASDETIVVPENMRRVCIAMTRIADEFGGTYDGWETAIHLDDSDPICPLCDGLRDSDQSLS